MKRGLLHQLQRNIIAGILIVVPVWLTIWVLAFLVRILVEFGRPPATELAALMSPAMPGIASLLAAPWFLDALAVAIVLGVLLALGTAGRVVIGARLLEAFDQLMARIPLVQSIYGSARKLVNTIQTKPDGHQRVVLITFPHPGMKAVGLVTRTFRDPASGVEIAAVYVPTTPNPSSGYVELVPSFELVPLDWTVNEALTFIISGGAVAPEGLIYSCAVSNEPLVRS